MWIAAAQFQDLSAKFVRKRLTQIFTFFSPGIQADFEVEQIGRNLIDHNISSRGKESVALDDKWKKAIRHDGLPKGDRKLRPQEIAHAIVSALQMDDRGFITDLTVWATNPD
jgi:hypothetical protein